MSPRANARGLIYCFYLNLFRPLTIQPPIRYINCAKQIFSPVSEDKMKKKLLASLLVLIVALTCALSLTACNLVDFWKGVFSGLGNGGTNGDINNDTDNDNAEIDSESGLAIKLNSNGNSYSVSLYDDDKTEIVIPSEYKELPVTSIAAFGFYQHNTLKSITIPDSITEIGLDAFSCCNSLKNITIPDSVTKIGSDAFEYCYIETATIPAIACKYINNSDLKTVVITSGKSIADNAFINCTSLTSVTIPNSVTEIGWSAFLGCTSLKSITIPDSVTSIGSGAFKDCPLETATIPAIACTYIYSPYDSDFKLKTVVITSGKSIDNNAFEYCTTLSSITIPDSVTSIGYLAFYHCSSLKSITIPGSVTKIGSSALAFCENLTSLTYKGTLSDWNAISKDNDWKDYSYFTIYCTDGQISGGVVSYY